MIIQRARPDMLLINEFDFDADGAAARLFQDNYLSVGQGGARPTTYRYRFTAPSNTGIASGFDLNNNGDVVTTPGAAGYGDDAFGFRAFPGQFGMVVYARHPIDVRGVRTFQKFRWKDMPGAALPGDPATPAPGVAFVIAGDQNADPDDGDSYQGAIHQLLDHPRIDSRRAPSSPGAVEAAATQGGANSGHTGDPKYDTADFADTAPGNLRADYVLPSERLRTAGGGVFWPVSADPLSRLTGVFPFPSSDHRLVWLDTRP
ncbi:endonuclease/exonuclease/phosphatase family protein [Nonomuraea sp. B12E4]|uniref:endonuclease/exonuclease/phosphatase family protein n=1 Tax=Nonomuraea sp. B12E4 TaxID=3153564 RepID=UPI00325DE028